MKHFGPEMGCLHCNGTGIEKISSNDEDKSKERGVWCRCILKKEVQHYLGEYVDGNIATDFDMMKDNDGKIPNLFIYGKRALFNDYMKTFLMNSILSSLEKNKKLNSLKHYEASTHEMRSITWVQDKIDNHEDENLDNYKNYITVDLLVIIIDQNQYKEACQNATLTIIDKRLINRLPTFIFSPYYNGKNVYKNTKSSAEITDFINDSNFEFVDLDKWGRNLKVSKPAKAEVKAKKVNTTTSKNGI